MAKLLEQAASENKKLFLQFGGQGAPYIKELTNLYNDPDLKELFDNSLSALNDCLKDPTVSSDTLPLPHGLDLKSWLEDAQTIPSDLYLSYCSVSMPLIALTQIGHYYKFMKAGYTGTALMEKIAGITGHSQGIAIAVLAALNLSEKDYLEQAPKFFQFLFYTGFRSQQTYPHPLAPEDIAKESEEFGDKGISSMAAVIACDPEKLKALVAEANKDLPEDRQLYVSLFNTPDSNIISGFPSSQLAFRKKFKEQMDADGIKLVYLRTTSAFHCNQMKGADDRFAPDLKTMAFNYKGSDLQAPVFSFSDGRDFSKDEDLGLTLFQEIIIHNLHWDKAMGYIINNDDVGYLLDFGPSKTTLRLSQGWFPGKELTGLALATPKDFKKI